MNASAALSAIMAKGMQDPDHVKFVSRGDDSGTHAREKLLWKNAGYNYSDIYNNSEANSTKSWYIDAGQGMGATLNMANELQAYTLTDMSTFMAYQGNLSLVSLIEGGDELLNVYVGMVVNPQRHPGVNCALANEFIDYLVSDEGQELIASFEAAALRDPNSLQWCPAMLRDGITATLGPVNEPYLFAFPEPRAFFAALYDGRCLVEAYFLTQRFTSWQMVLIGDPLYRPFKTRPTRTPSTQ